MSLLTSWPASWPDQIDHGVPPSAGRRPRQSKSWWLCFPVFIKTASLAPDSGSPPSLLFLLWTVLKKPFLLLSLAFSPNLSLFLFLHVLPVFCFYSAFWRTCFQFLSKSFRKSELVGEILSAYLFYQVSPPFFPHQAHLLPRQKPSAPLHILTGTCFLSVSGHQYIPILLWISSTLFPHINSPLLRSKVISHLSSHSNSETPPSPALSNFLLFPKASSPAQALISSCGHSSLSHLANLIDRPTSVSIWGGLSHILPHVERG